jgi:CubicO group peptidase (beta-lactamase class C family)
MSKPLVVLMGIVLMNLQPNQACAQAGNRQAPLTAAIDALVKKNGITDEGPGVAILATQGNRVMFQKGYGLANLESRAPITPETLFELASVSKTFTATAILILQEQSRLSIDDDVRQHIPELPEYTKGHPIRIRDLMHHVSGLPDYMQFEDVPARHEQYWTNEDYVGEFARHKKDMPLKFPTGAKYEYNNTNYMLLAVVIERVSKQSYADYLHDHIFTPAGMKNSFVYQTPKTVPAESGRLIHAIGYEKAKKKPWKEGWGTPPARYEKMLTVGDGAVWTNLEDMAKWDKALRDHVLIREKTMQLALTPSKTTNGKKNDYGLGWLVYSDKSGKMNGFGHEGAWGGFQTSYYRYLVADRTSVILSNRGGFDPDKFWYALNDVLEEHGR